ncbi:MAG: radical SAM protein [Candidatus Omnitrophica bacterium]|nr:radical SAM protein [Candidatus Omnitrophota bacterium]MDD5310187.1 radical SAM protein [Candidatus Omnitrophota bacterium]MDD5546236.1 radical SAM protein [Candidatus Omnitrophota bacterium]
MEDRFRIDGHKLMFHIGRVDDWLKGKQVSPIYLEIAPSGACNHRCVFCAVDYLGYKARFLDLNVLKKTVRQAGGLGVKSVMYAGEGEPLLYKDICEIIKYTKGRGIDVAVTTNGALLNKEISRKILKYLTWIRISLNAGTAGTYSKIHRTRKEDFYKVMENLREAVKIKRNGKLKTTIGVQLLLIPGNVKEVAALARILKKTGVDYLTVKPYSQHPLSGSRINPGFRHKDHISLYEKLRGLEDDRFKISFRDETMKRLRSGKEYARCLGLPFWAYIDANGEVYACSAFLGKKGYSFGNIYKNSFEDIIKGRRRRAVMAKISSKTDVEKCRRACRLDKINSYLWELSNPGPHVNFI